MQLKLKENPREWQKFTAVMMTLLLIISALLWRQGVLARRGFFWIMGAALVVCAASLVWPKLFRTFYRVGTTATFQIGRVIGAVMLTLFFLLVVTPLGLLLRAMGKDLLRLKRSSSCTTYWQPAKNSNDFNRLF